MTEDAAGSPPPATDRAAYRIWTYDKLRYCDTDRQGHINTAIFATFLETGRVTFLYDQDLALTARGCEFVLARVEIDYRAELFYPGTVDIGTRVIRIGRTSFTVEQGVFRDELCAATGTTVLVQMLTDTRRPHPLSPAMTVWLEERMAPSA